MAFCTNCGKKLLENEKFCPACGAAQAKDGGAEANTVPPIVDIPLPGGGTASPAQGTTNAPRSINVGLLIWSILNLVFCCMPLGIASLIMTVLAKDAPNMEEESKKLKTAKVCNLIGTIASVVFYIVYFAIIVIVTMLAEA